MSITFAALDFDAGFNIGGFVGASGFGLCACSTSSNVICPACKGVFQGALLGKGSAAAAWAKNATAAAVNTARAGLCSRTGGDIIRTTTLIKGPIATNRGLSVLPGRARAVDSDQ